jgi:hypothetical protein
LPSLALPFSPLDHKKKLLLSYNIMKGDSQLPIISASTDVQFTGLVLLGDNLNGPDYMLAELGRDRLNENKIVEISVGVGAEFLSTTANLRLFEEMQIDQCYNYEQMKIVQDHYVNEFGGLSHHLAKVVRDYKSDSVIHKVIDGVPHTYKVKRGVVQMHQDMDDLENFYIQHVAVNHNHARTFWQARSPNTGIVMGMDSFTFNDRIQITKHTSVVLSNDPHAWQSK